jgi:hypothetical protein
VRVVIVSIFRLTMKFLKIEDRSQVNKSREYVKIYLFSYLLSYLFLHLPNILYFLRYDLLGVRNKVRTFSLFTVVVSRYPC